MARNKLDIQKRQHRERSQPLNRQRLGLLEKHQDYVKRAKDYHSKQDRIKNLRQKAGNKNPDEFYFGMINSKTDPRGGFHIQTRASKTLETDLVKILKTQDFNYVKTCRAIEEKKINKLKQQLGSLIVEVKDEDGPVEGSNLLKNRLAELVATDTSATRASCGSDNESNALHDQKVTLPKKTIFVDSLDLVHQPWPSTSSQKKKNPKALNQPPSSPHVLLESPEPCEAPRRHVERLMEKFKARLIRLRTLQTAERELEIKKALMTKGRKMLKNATTPSKKKTLTNGRDLSWYDKLDRNELIEQEEERERLQKLNSGIKTGAAVWKWKAERKR